MKITKPSELIQSSASTGSWVIVKLYSNTGINLQQTEITLSIKDWDDSYRSIIWKGNWISRSDIWWDNWPDKRTSWNNIMKKTSPIVEEKGSSEVVAKKEEKATLSIAMELIKSFECKNWIHTTAYKDHAQWTIGCGTKAKVWNERITEEEALKRLAVRAKVDVDVVVLDFPRHSQQQQAALASLRFNCPSVYNWLARTWITENKFKSCVYASDKKQPWLVKRRNAEWLVYISKQS